MIRIRILPLKGAFHGLCLNKSHKGQATIEFALAFIITLLFLVLTCRVFVWFGGNLLRRQVAYDKSRVEAGGGLTTGWWWWKKPAGTRGELDFYQAPKLDLFGKDVFKK